MLRSGLPLLAAFLFVLTFAACQTTQIAQDDIIGFVDDYEKKAEYVNRRVSQCLWEYYTENNADSLEYYQELQRRLNYDHQLLSKVKEFRSRISDEDYAHKLDKIYRQGLRNMISKRSEIKHLTDSLIAVFNQNQFSFEGKAINKTTLEDIISTDSDRDRRQAAFRVLNAPGEKVSDGIKRLARLRNQATVSLGYNSFFDLMLIADGLSREEYNNFIQELDQLTAEPYRSVLDSLADLLKVDNIQPWDINFVLGLDADRFDGYFPESNQVALANATLKGLGININNWPIYIASAVTVIKEDVNIYLPVHIPEDVRLVVSPGSGYQSFKEYCGLLGQAVYAVHMDRTNYLNTTPTAPCFGSAMAMIIQRMIDKDVWLRRYAGMPEPEVIKISSSSAIIHLIDLRKALVHVHFEKEIYKNPYADMDQLYATLFEKYMFISPEVENNTWATDIDLIKKPVYLPNLLFAQCIVGQTYNYLEKKYGSIVDNTHTREFMVQNYYRFGGSTDWRILVSRGTGEELNPEYLLKYCGI